MIRQSTIFGVLGAVLALPISGRAGGRYAETPLVSDTVGSAAHGDPALLNPWGLAADAGQGRLWVANNHAGNVTAYDATGQPLGVTITIPAAPGNPTGAPTGLVLNSGGDFHGDHLILVSEDGIVSGWSSGATATVEADRSGSGAIYKGLALATARSGPRLYATDFHNGKVDVFDASFQPIISTGFTDPKVPAGFAPFGVHALRTKIFVTYARQDEDKEDDVAGAGNGLIDVFDTEGKLLHRFASGSAAGGKLTALDSPWAVTTAPAHFGTASHLILVGNFGSGQIAAFSGRGRFHGLLKDTAGNPLALDGLWTLAFGAGGAAGDAHTLYFAAGPDHEDHGLVGTLGVARHGH